MSYALTRHLRRTAIITQQIRLENTLTNVTREDFVFHPPFAQWSKVIREAEKIVGYPTSFMNNMAMHLRKIVGSNHPILKTAKSVLYNEHNNRQPWGLIILLLSKAINPTTNTLQTNSVMEQQRMLAELTEMFRTAHYIHRGLLNIPTEERDSNSGTAIFANKIAILIGDFLIVTANGMLARLKNNDLKYLIWTALRDLSEGEFFGDRDDQNMPLPGKPITNNNDEFVICCDTLPLDVTETLGSPIKEWTLRTMYNGGSMFGRGCQGALLLGSQSLEEQEKVYSFGSHLCLAWQAASELQKFTSNNKESFSLVSAPVLFALNDNPDLYSVIQKGKNNITEIDFDDLRSHVLRTDAIEKTRLLYEENSRKAAIYIEMIGDSEPIHLIKRLIKAL